MRIIQIEDFFHPDAGYQINLLAKYMARDGHDVTIITSELDKIPDYLKSFFGSEDISEHDRVYQEQYGVRIIRVPIIRYFSGRAIYRCKEVWKLIDEIDPDVLFLHGNDTYFSIRSFLRVHRFSCTIVSDSHMVDMASRNRFNRLFYAFYKRIVAPVLIKEHIPVIRTVDDDYVQTRLGIPLSQCPVISLGTDTFLFRPDGLVKKEMRAKLGIEENAFVILYAGKLDESKGGSLLAQLTNQAIESDKEIVFLIIGNSVGDYGKQIDVVFKNSKYRVVRLPTQRYTELASFYQSADIAVIPKQCSLSIFDYAASGLPVVAEENSINLERIRSLLFGKTFSADDVISFRDAVMVFTAMSSEEMYKASEHIAVLAKEKYGFDKQYSDYMRVIIEAGITQRGET